MKFFVILQLLLVKYVLSNPLANEEIAKPRENDDVYRLPKTVSPFQYTLQISPNFETDKFSGSVLISVIALQNTTTITINQKDLTIKQENIEIKGENTTTVNITKIDPDVKKELLTITLDKDIIKDNKYTINFTSFEGNLNTENVGFYIAYFKDEKGTSRKFGTTQFEPTHARRAFPCFDEPAYKATFILKIKVPSGYTAYANTDGSVPSNDGLVTFEETPKMSTYLLAFVVSEMKMSDKLGIHRVLAKPQDITDNKQKCALDIGNATIAYLEDYFGIKYELKKMDQVAIPDEYFKSGAMENWGLVTYRESRLLCSSKTTAAVKQIIAAIIGHEFAHQWFGNIVSPAWWNYIWLNEGFATYFEAVASDLVYPHMDLMKQFLVSSVHLSLFQDGFGNTRELNMDAESPDEIWALFDTIAYDKGASIIHMMDGFLTTPVLKKGLIEYLKAMKYQVATPSDLYDKIQQVNNNLIIPVLPDSLTLNNIMSTWDSQKGYPVVNVTRNYGATTDNVELAQGRFFIENPTKSTEKWTIPINFVSANYPSFDDTTPDLWFIDQKQNATVPFVSDSDWIIVNKKQTGYYRVNYDITNWNLIKNELLSDHSKIDVRNRAQIVDDSFILARSGHLGYDIPMSISSYLKKEKDYVAFHPFYRAIKHLDAMLYFTNERNKFKSHIIDVLQEVYQTLKFEEIKEEKHTDILNQENVIHWLCKMGHSECRSTALEKFTDWKNNNKEISVNLQASVFCGAMRTATLEDYEFLYTKAETVAFDDRDLRSAMISALGCSENEEILHKYLNSSIKVNTTFGPDLVILSVCNGGDIGLQTVLQFLSIPDNFKEVEKRSSNIKQLLNVVASLISGENQLKQLEEISKKHNETLFKNALERANANKEWLSTTGAFITSIFRDESSGSMLLSNFVVLTVAFMISKVF